MPWAQSLALKRKKRTHQEKTKWKTTTTQQRQQSTKEQCELELSEKIWRAVATEERRMLFAPLSHQTCSAPPSQSMRRQV